MSVHPVRSPLARTAFVLAAVAAWSVLPPAMSAQVREQASAGVAEGDIEIDGVLSEGAWSRSAPIRENSSWDAVWEASTVRDAEGWTVEIRIPAQSLTFDASLDGEPNPAKC